MPTSPTAAEFSTSPIASWWPVLAVAVLLGACFENRLGSAAARGLKALNDFIHDVLCYPGAWLLGMVERHDVVSPAEVLGRWFVFLAWLVSLWGAVWLTGPTEEVKFYCALAGSLLALSAGGYWVGKESRALEADEELDQAELDKSVRIAHSLQARGALALNFVLAFMPLCFLMANAAFDCFEARDATLHGWMLYSVNLLLQAVIDFGDVFDFKVSDTQP